MDLTLLGTGCPKVDSKRFGPANLVNTKDTKILIDCGSGVTQRLDEIKVSTAEIDALFLTHLHSDHVIDLYQLIISSWHSYRIKPWKIFGPKGTKKFVSNIIDVPSCNINVSGDTTFSNDQNWKVNKVMFIVENISSNITHLRLVTRSYSSGYNNTLHTEGIFDGNNVNVFYEPVLTISEI